MSSVKVVLLGAIGVAIIVQLIASGQTDQSLPKSQQTPTVVPTTSEVATPVVFDIPKLVGKSIKQIESTLGPATRSFEPTDLQEEMGVIDADKTFDIDGVSLMITYNSRTGIVKEYFLETPDPSGATANTGSLLKLGHLENGATNYRIKFIPTIKDPSVYTGVVVTPI